MSTKIARYSKLIAGLIAVTLTAGAGLIAPEGLEWLSLLGALVGVVTIWAAPKNAEPAA
jgi:hypothetical protein